MRACAAVCGSDTGELKAFDVTVADARALALEPSAAWGADAQIVSCR